MKDLFICSPEHYRCDHVQQYIADRCMDIDKQWIYHLIDGHKAFSSEVVFIDNAEWMLCKDLHPGRDTRYLIIFKDHTLRTLRELENKHLPMLSELQSQVQAFLLRLHPQDCLKFRVFFHYMPSVFQLHAHVSMHASPQHTVRRHHMRHVISNIQKVSHHYKEALILTTSTACLRTERPAGVREERITQARIFQRARIRCI